MNDFIEKKTASLRVTINFIVSHGNCGMRGSKAGFRDDVQLPLRWGNVNHHVILRQGIGTPPISAAKGAENGKALLFNYL